MLLHQRANPANHIQKPQEKINKYACHDLSVWNKRQKSHLLKICSVTISNRLKYNLPARKRTLTRANSIMAGNKMNVLPTDPFSLITIQTIAGRAFPSMRTSWDYPFKQGIQFHYLVSWTGCLFGPNAFSLKECEGWQRAVYICGKNHNLFQKNLIPWYQFKKLLNQAVNLVPRAFSNEVVILYAKRNERTSWRLHCTDCTLLIGVRLSITEDVNSKHVN